LAPSAARPAPVVAASAAAITAAAITPVAIANAQLELRYDIIGLPEIFKRLACGGHVLQCRRHDTPPPLRME
jgi:hypothetical protein